MIELLRVTREDDLSSLNDFVHDSWFDLGKIKLDYNSAILDIEFTREMFEERIPVSGWLVKKIEIPVFTCYLRFRNVINHEIIDTEKIGLYDFNLIEYDNSTKVVSVNTGIPLSFQILVRTLDISVYRDDVPLRFELQTMIDI